MDNSIRICKPRYHQCPTILGTGKFDGKFDAKRWREENRRNGAVQRQTSYRRWGRGVIWCARFLFLSVRVINDYHNNRHYTVYRGLPNEVSGRLSGKRKGREGEERGGERERERGKLIYTLEWKKISALRRLRLFHYENSRNHRRRSLFSRERKRERSVSKNARHAGERRGSVRMDEATICNLFNHWSICKNDDEHGSRSLSDILWLSIYQDLKNDDGRFSGQETKNANFLLLLRRYLWYLNYLRR